MGWHPFPDATCDVALLTLMMHLCRAPTKREGLAEIARVLTPGERLPVIAERIELAQPKDCVWIPERKLMKSTFFATLESQGNLPTSQSALANAALGGSDAIGSNEVP